MAEMTVVEKLFPTKYKGYFVDKYGNVWSTKRGLNKLSPVLTRGYPQVGLSVDGKHVSAPIHRLMCAAFHGEKPSAEYEVRHLDGNRKNNTPDNLCWGTRSENMQDAIKHGTHVILHIKRIPGINGGGQNAGIGIKITKEEVLKIKEEYKAGGIYQYEIAKKFNISQSLVCRIVNNLRWGSIK